MCLFGLFYILADSRAGTTKSKPRHITETWQKCQAGQLAQLPTPRPAVMGSVHRKELTRPCIAASRHTKANQNVASFCSFSPISRRFSCGTSSTPSSLHSGVKKNTCLTSGCAAQYVQERSKRAGECISFVELRSPGVLSLAFACVRVPGPAGGAFEHAESCFISLLILRPPPRCNTCWPD